MEIVNMQWPYHVHLKLWDKTILSPAIGTNWFGAGGWEGGLAEHLNDTRCNRCVYTTNSLDG